MQMAFPQGLLLLGSRTEEGHELVDALLARTYHLPLSKYSLGAHLRSGGRKWVEEWKKLALEY